MNCPQVHICSLPLEPPSHLPPLPTPLACHKAPGLSSLNHTANSRWLYSGHVVTAYASAPLSVRPALPFLPVSTRLFWITCVPTAALLTGSTVPSF